MAQLRKTRRDRGHARVPLADPDCMTLLMRLWAGDTLDSDGGELKLVHQGHTFTILTESLDELEFGRGWIHPPVPGSHVALTYAGKLALAAWMGKLRPGMRAAVNERGERLAFPRG